MKYLVLVESPAKAKTIERYLGKNYSVKSTKGHVRDLPKSKMGVDLENDFEPHYINSRDKTALIKELKAAAKGVDQVLLATDPDREGEAIAWHIAEVLKVDIKGNCRIVFNEITKPCILGAVKQPRCIDFNLVEAQQTRRILDRIVGYELSPLLWQKIKKGLSAGRVQSVVVRLVCEREQEIKSFQPEEYWTIDALLNNGKPKGDFSAALTKISGKKAKIANKTQNDLIVAELNKSKYTVSDLAKKQRKKAAPPPFITSTLQQDASRRLNMTPRRVMQLAQQLYEGMEVPGFGHTGLITYMRTDSYRISEQALLDARAIIADKFGNSYLPEKPNYYKKKAAQDAHEAIRPVDALLNPEKLKNSLGRDQLRLYKLIWDRFIACQMTPAVYDVETCDISAGKYLLHASGSRRVFAGYLAVYDDGGEEASDKQKTLPELELQQQLKLLKIDSAQKFTEPPPRYTEPSLIKLLEDLGIGRPSTFVPIIETIVDRGYVDKIEKKFVPTELGFIVNDLLVQYFDSIVNVEFTAKMEHELDEIAAGEMQRVAALREFYKNFGKDLAIARENAARRVIEPVVTEEICPKCGKNLVKKSGRFGEFLACPGYPECKFTKPVTSDSNFICPQCKVGKLSEKRSKKGKKFFGCTEYPACNYATWDVPIEEKCPKCGEYMLKHLYKGRGAKKVCSNVNCSYGKEKPVKKNEKTDN